MHLKVMEMITRGLLLAPTVQFPVMLIPYFMLTLKMTREFLVVQVVLRFLGIQVVDETIEIELGQIPGHTSGGDSDESIEIDVVGETPGHTARGRTMEAAEIVATLAAGGDPDWLPDLTVPEEPEESLVHYDRRL